MKEISICLFIMLSCTFFIVCRGQEQAVDIVDKTISSVSKVILKYKSEFGAKKNFSELQSTMKGIQEFIDDNDYEGTIIYHDLRKSYSLLMQLQHTYKSCVDDMNWSCYRIGSTLNTYFKFAQYFRMAELLGGKHFIITMIDYRFIKTAEVDYRESLKLFKSLQPKLIELKTQLDATISDLHKLNDNTAKSRVLIEKINTANQIIDQFNGDFDEDENNLNLFSTFSSNKEFRELLNAVSRESGDQMVSLFKDLGDHCSEYNSWYAITFPTE